MIIGKIVGNLVSSIKIESLRNYKLLIVAPLNDEQKQFVAIDMVGAGIDSIVLVTNGSQVQNCFSEKTPVDSAIVGIVEIMNLHKNGS